MLNPALKADTQTGLAHLILDPRSPRKTRSPPKLRRRSLAVSATETHAMSCQRLQCVAGAAVDVSVAVAGVLSIS